MTIKVPRNDNMDADSTIFFEKELQSIEGQVYEVKKAEFLARSIFPIDSSDGEGCETICFRMSEGSSPNAEVIAPGASHFPRSDVKMKEYVSKVVRIGAAYGYNDDEIDAARFAGRPLEQMRAIEARRMIARKENDMAFFGDDEAGIVGFLLNPDIPRLGSPVGVSTSSLWSTKTADEILTDLCSIANTSRLATENVEVPDTLLLPSAQFLRIHQTEKGTEGTRTVIEHFKAMCPWITTIADVPLLAAASGAADMAVCYRRDPVALALKIPMPMRQLAPFRDGPQSWELCLKQKMGPVVVRYPLSVCFMTGI